MNEHDSEILAGYLDREGWQHAQSAEESGLILLNTCCIREKAENKVLSLLGEYEAFAEKNPELVIGVCGCMIQQKNIVPRIRHAAPHVQLLFGTNNLRRLPEYLKTIEETGDPVFEIVEQIPTPEELEPVKRKFSYKACVNITYGCNNFCTYCIVPYVRGRERSRRASDILNEVKILVDQGVIEVTLLGQNVNSYGNDFGDEGTSFPELLRQVDEIPRIKRVRFMTSHPKDFSPELIKVIAEGKHICHQIHLPVQSGSNEVLRRMNRKYTREHYLDTVKMIRQALPDAAITTDIIVGFPGETEEQFEETISLVKEVGYDSAFSFVYSKRAGTVAAGFEDPVPLEEKKRRLARLNKVLSDSAIVHNRAIDQQVVEVLVEGQSKNDPTHLSGRTDSGKTVIFPGPDSLTGSLVNVKITHPQTWILKGELIKQ